MKLEGMDGWATFYVSPLPPLSYLVSMHKFPHDMAHLFLYTRHRGGGYVMLIGNINKLTSRRHARNGPMCVHLLSNLLTAAHFQKTEEKSEAGIELSRAMRKCVLCHMRRTKAQISLHIRAV